jgi:hypothetical protein
VMDTVVKHSYFTPTRTKPSPILTEEVILFFKDKFDLKVMLVRMQKDCPTCTNTIQMLQILSETCPDDFNVFMNKFSHVRILENGRYALSASASFRRESVFIDAEDFMKDVTRTNKSKRFWCILGIFVATAIMRMHF